MAEPGDPEAPEETAGPTVELDEPTASIHSTGAQSRGGAPVLAEGHRVGRYIVLRVLGEGGMGVVYEAYDPSLERRVAVKLIRVRGGAQDTDGARDRLLREAQALAQLSHPNVIAVHDIGVHDDQVFVAMELVRGRTLKSWLADRRRPLSEILHVMSAAGRGLAAAHDAGLIHRDFKPDNVLVGDDGRVRVIDFGLARAATLDEPAPGDAAEPTARDAVAEATADERALSVSGELGEETPTSRSGERLRTPLTVAGAVIGTPPYMAPEQYLSHQLDQYTDQFSFCVALFEAVYGERPFQGRSVAQLRHQIIDGRVRAPERSAPRWLHRIILEGLSVDPAARFASMQALLAELERVPRTRRRVGYAALALAAVSALSAVTLATRGGSGQAPCRGASDSLAAVWDDQVRAAIRAAFEATGRAHAVETHERVAQMLDERAAAWSAMWTQACEATRVRGEQSEHLLDLRMHCLDAQLRELGALTRVFATEADLAVVDGAVSAVHQLPALRQCADIDWLTAEIPPPPPALAGRVERARARLEEAQALERAGKVNDGFERIGPVVAEAEAIGYAPLLADALHVRGRLQFDLRDGPGASASLIRAAEMAAEMERHELFADTSVALVDVYGTAERRHREALALVPLVRAGLALAPRDPARRARLEALAGHQLVDLGKLEEARARYQRALEVAEPELGPDHPEVAALYGGIATTLYREGAYDQAIQMYERAVAGRERGLGADHPGVAIELTNLAYALSQAGRFDEARARYERAIGILERQLGADHPDTAWALNDLGLLEAELRNWERAIAHYQRAVDILETKHGPMHPDLSFPLVNLGAVAVAQERFDDALALCGRVRVIRDAMNETSDPYAALHLHCLGTAHLGSGAAGRAVGPLQTALALFEELGGEPGEIASAKFALARALVAAGLERARAIELATAARAVYAEAGDHRREQLREVERWLDQQGAGGER